MHPTAIVGVLDELDRASDDARDAAAHDGIAGTIEGNAALKSDRKSVV